MKNSGFTLVELLVVIVLIGILASIGAPSFMRSQQYKKNYNIVRDIESALSFAFSLTRSERVQARAFSDGTDFVVESCKEEDCFIIQRTIIPEHINIPSDLEIVFNYPHGDILIPEQERMYTIAIEDSNDFSLFVLPVSGLIYSQKND